MSRDRWELCRETRHSRGQDHEPGELAWRLADLVPGSRRELDLGQRGGRVLLRELVQPVPAGGEHDGKVLDRRVVTGLEHTSGWNPGAAAP